MDRCREPWYRSRRSRKCGGQIGRRKMNPNDSAARFEFGSRCARSNNGPRRRHPTGTQLPFSFARIPRAPARSRAQAEPDADDGAACAGRSIDHACSLGRAARPGAGRGRRAHGSVCTREPEGSDRALARYAGPTACCRAILRTSCSRRSSECGSSVSTPPRVYSPPCPSTTAASRWPGAHSRGAIGFA